MSDASVSEEFSEINSASESEAESIGKGRISNLTEREEVQELAGRHLYHNERTKKAYLPKIKEFQAWCRTDAIQSRKDPASRYTVTPECTLRFLDYIKTRGRKKNGQALSYSSMNGYVNAVTKYWQSQTTSNSANPAVAPRDHNVRNMLKAYKAAETQMRRERYEDRAQRTLMDAYVSWDDVCRLSKFFVDQKTTIGMRNRAVCILCQNAVLRGASARKIQLADLFYAPLENEGPMICNVLMIVMDQGTPS